MDSKKCEDSIGDTSALLFNDDKVLRLNITVGVEKSHNVGVVVV